MEKIIIEKRSFSIMQNVGGKLTCGSYFCSALSAIAPESGKPQIKVTPNGINELLMYTLLPTCL